MVYGGSYDTATLLLLLPGAWYMFVIYLVPANEYLVLPDSKPDNSAVSGKYVRR